MALNNTQLVTVAEITQETFSAVESLASSLNAAQEAAIAADVVTWNLNRDDVDVWLSNPSGANWQAQRLLNAIRERTRKALGLSLISPEVSGYSTSIPTVGVF